MHGEELGQNSPPLRLSVHQRVDYGTWRSASDSAVEAQDESIGYLWWTMAAIALPVLVFLAAVLSPGSDSVYSFLFWIHASGIVPVSYLAVAVGLFRSYYLASERSLTYPLLAVIIFLIHCVLFGGATLFLAGASLVP